MRNKYFWYSFRKFWLGLLDFAITIILGTFWTFVIICAVAVLWVFLMALLGYDSGLRFLIDATYRALSW